MVLELLPAVPLQPSVFSRVYAVIWVSKSSQLSRSKYASFGFEFSAEAPAYDILLD